MLFSEFFGIEGAPVIIARHGNALGLGRAIRSSSWLGQVLLVVGLSKIPEPAVLVVVGGGSDFRRNLFGATEGLFIRLLGGLDQRLLFVVKVVKSRSILRSAVVSLSHTGARIVGLPEPTKDVDKTDLFGVIDDANTFCVPSSATASLLIGRIRCESGTVPNGSTVDSSKGQSPDSLFASPEATVGKDGNLVALGDLLELVSKDVVPQAINVGHFLASAREGFRWADQPGLGAPQQIQNVGDHAALCRRRCRGKVSRNRRSAGNKSCGRGSGGDNS